MTEGVKVYVLGSQTQRRGRRFGDKKSLEKSMKITPSYQNFPSSVKYILSTVKPWKILAQASNKVKKNCVFNTCVQCVTVWVSV